MFQNLRSRASVVILLAAMALLVAGCGNRQPYERLKADATGGASTQADGMRAQLPANAIQPEPGSSEPKQVPAVPSATDGGAPAAPGGATSSSAGVQGSAGSHGGKAAGGRPQNSVGCVASLAPIKIGSIGANSGVLGAILGIGPKTLQAWVQWTNAKGGVACHPVELFVGDDNSDPAINQSLVRSFVEQKGVVAFVFMSSPLAGAASIGYLTQKGIPVFGSEGGSQWFNENPTFLPQNTSGTDAVEFVMALGSEYKQQGLTKVGTVACVELQICSVVYEQADPWARKYGLTPVYRSQVSITAPDYTSTCLAAKNAGAQILYLGVDGNTDLRIARSCASVGYHPKLVTPATGLSPAQASAPALAGIRMAAVTAPWFANEVPVVADYSAALARYAPGLEKNGAGIGAWVAGEVFAWSAARAKAHPTLSSKSLLEGAYTVTKNDFGGVTVPLTYKAGPHQRQQLCYWGIEFNGTKATALNSGKRKCV